MITPSDHSFRTPGELSQLAYEASVTLDPDAAELAAMAAEAYTAHRGQLQEHNARMDRRGMARQMAA